MLRDLQLMYSVGTLAGLTDRSLIESFRSANREGDPVRAEAALSAVIDRHAVMVWNVCRSFIRDVHDAENAFQATFLILVRKADSLRVGETLGPWLHVVAYRTALGVRSSVARRRDVERSAAARLHEAFEIDNPAASSEPADDLRASIQCEIMRLPEAFRAVVVLCDLEGLAYLEAARRLDVPLGTVQSRLARARRRLRRSLTLKGIHPFAEGDARDPSAGPALGWTTAGGLPPSLVGRIGRLGALIASDPARLKTTVAGSVQALIRRGLRSMFLGQVKRVLVLVLGAALVGGTFLYTDARSGQTERPARRQVQSQDKAREQAGIPAPRRLAATSGHGKILVFKLDDRGVRVPTRPDVEDGPFKEDERETRWVVVTGVIDHHKVQKALIVAERKPLPPAELVYRRVELERQALRKDGSWSDWKKVDAQANLDILDNLPANEDERVAPQFRVDGLVDPLPFLTSSKWRGVDHEDFLPAEKEALPERRPSKDEPAQPEGMRGVMLPSGNHREDGARPPGSPLALHRDRPPILMMRSLDFTVEPGRTYRHRARFVLFNPHYDREKPGDRKESFSPWSDATDIVTVPAPR